MGSGGLGGGSNQQQGTQLQQLQSAPSITAPTGTASGGGAGGLSQSNFLSGYYANPYYQGILANATAGAAPGGFGQPLYGNNGGTGGGQIGYAGGGTTGGRISTGTNATGSRGTTGAGGTTGRAGGTGGIGGLGGNSSSQNQSAMVVAPSVPISYAAVARFDITPVAPAQLKADISGMIARTGSQLSNAAGIQVLTEGNVVTLRGAVKDIEEARLIEGMARLTPGVGLIRNELTFPITQP
jgi:hypothetical protein